MQDRYAGDVGDFGKYGLLRALTASDLRLGMAWCRVADESHNADGRYTEYLGKRHEPRFRPLDPPLYDALGQLVETGRRSVQCVMSAGILPAGTASFDEELHYRGIAPGARRAVRDRWFARAFEVTVDCDLVFFDPDNGIANGEATRGPRDVKHVFLEELQPFVDRGQSVVVYHHLGRAGAHAEQIRNLAARLAVLAGRGRLVPALRYHPWSARAFLVIPARQHEERLETRFAAFCTRWMTAVERIS